VADLTAAKIVAETAGADRLASKDAFARHNGTAPLPVWSGNQTRHRLSRTGNRQLNYAILRIAVTQNAATPMPRPTCAGVPMPATLRPGHCAPSNGGYPTSVYRTLLADTVAITTRSGQAALTLQLDIGASHG
jgi:Transposase IS116/IS110/IS902 family